ncbi:MAG: hypothetical protein JXR76_20740 [Deltaproteobacteria bacterium]|nr:hypothetical protein [Deltaproteobacteria bacterium]
MNFGIVPLTFESPADCDAIDQDDELSLAIGDLAGDVTFLSDPFSAEL